MNRLLRASLGVLCSVALAVALVPAAAISALAAGTNIGGLPTFERNGVVYAITSDTDVWGHYVQVSGYTSEIGSVVTIPSTVASDEGVTYTVTGIEKEAFEGCSTIEDVRVADLTHYDSAMKADDEGTIAASAFDNCENLRVIHLYGDVSFSAQTHLDNTMLGIGALKIIVHGGTWSAEAAFEDISESDNNSTAGFPGGTESYYAVTFKQGSSSVELFVKGPGLTSEDAYVAGTKVGKLASLDASDVYCDALLGSDSVCPNDVASVPALSGSNDAWSFKGASGIAFGPDDSVTCVGAATAVDSSDLANAQVVLESSELTYRGAATAPVYTVVDAKGTTLSASDYTVRYLNEAGSEVSAITGAGSYSIEATATSASGYSGSCSAAFTVVAGSAEWSRYSGNGRCATANAGAAGANALASAAGAESPDMSFAIVVNPDDYASCALAASLSALGGYPIYTTNKKSLPTDTRVKLSFVSKAILLGTSSYVSDDVYSAIQDISSIDACMRVADESKDAAAAACDVATFVKACKAGEHGSLAFAEDFGSTALVLPATASTAVFSALSWGVANNTPVFFASSNGTVSADTTATLGSYSTVVAAGFAESAASTLATQLSGAQVRTWNASASDTQASVSFANQATAQGSSTAYVALAGANSYAAAAVAAAAAGYVGGVVLIYDGSSAGADALATWASSHENEVVDGIVVGGYADVPASLMERMEQLTQLNDGLNLVFADISIAQQQFVYSDKAVSPKITLKLTIDGTTSTLAVDTDYTLAYYNNDTNSAIRASNLKDVGVYTAVLTGSKNTHVDGYGASTTGVYTGSRSVEFSIVPAKPVVTLKAQKKALTVKAKKVAGATGYEISYKASGSKAKTKTVNSSKALSKKLTKLTSGKKYTVKVRAFAATDTKTLYSSWSKAKTAKAK